MNNVREYLDELVDEIIHCNTRIKIALDAARGLEHLHLNGIVHRDFKSSNLLVKEEANVMITKVRRTAIFFFQCYSRKNIIFIIANKMMALCISYRSPSLQRPSDSNELKILIRRN